MDPVVTTSPEATPEVGAEETVVENFASEKDNFAKEREDIDAAPAPAEGEAAPAPELYEFTFADHKFELPPETPAELRDKLAAIGKELHADYTRKTQTAAEQRKAAETRWQETETQINVAREQMVELAKLTSIDSQLEGYQNVDWAAWIDSDPQAAKEGYKAFEALQLKRNIAHTTLQENHQKGTAKNREHQAKLLADGNAVLATKIEGWGEAKQTAIGEFVGKEYGYQPHELANVLDHRLVLLMNDAMQYRASLKRAQTPAPSAPKPVPVAKVGTSATAGVNPDKMSNEDWNKWRNAQPGARPR